MFPVICHLGPFTLYSYGLMLAVAVVVGSLLTAREVARYGINREVIYDLAFWVVVCGIVGARLFYVFLNFDYFSQFPFEILMLQKGGLAWQGSLLTGVAAGIVFIRHQKLPLWTVLDAAAPFLALGHAIGRIGCLLNGCCYGKPVAWGLYFPVWGQHLHPTQIYMSAGEFFVFLILYVLQKQGKNPAGRLFVLYLVLSSAERFIVEFFRADHVEMWGGLSLFQYVCALVIAAALVVNARLGAKNNLDNK
ncbi:MAG: prolipoprotein diacylglyceryl transferase [Candidatus Omnitrophota bacterium]